MATETTLTFSAKVNAKPKATSKPTSKSGNAATDAAIDKTCDWFKQQDWTVFNFQKRAWHAWHDGQSGLIHSPTGSGKTLAAWMGPVQHALAHKQYDKGLQVLWITPLRALAGDTCENLQAACAALDAPLRVEVRTGDTSSSKRVKQRTNPPFALITTPESLSVLLSYADSKKTLANIHTVIVDEWHELMGSKRGVQLELCIARLRTAAPSLRTWGLSATLGNLDTAMQTLLGPAGQGSLIEGVQPRTIHVDSLIPDSIARIPWSGHLGLKLVRPVAEAIDNARSTLLFTNTRSQAELWFQALLDARPEWLFTLALHHGSIDRTLRQDMESRLRSGELSCVVCTSSLDLGVDFSPVDQVIQIGSPKGVARLMQRAGRSGHSPGAESRILCVPAHAFELVEIAAARRALQMGRIEARKPLTLSLDVLCQHLVTIALGEGFIEQDMLAEVRTSHAFAKLGDDQWQWVMDFITRGGQALQGYPQYHKVVEVTGTFRVMNEQIAKKHRMGIGTITSDSTMNVAFRGGKRLGTIEEAFITKVNNGDVFQFAGRQLQLLHTKDMTAYVKAATKRSRWVPRWQGTQLPLSTQLADSVLDTLQRWHDGNSDETDEPELVAIDSLLSVQQTLSHLPGPKEFLLEYTQTPEGYSLFCFAFAGRLAHEGLAMLVAKRLSALSPATFVISVNDYGFELQCPDEFEVSVESLKPVFTTDNLLDDILLAINASEISKRQFRDIARIAGLIFEGFPGRSKTTRQVQASSSLIYDVLEDFDADNHLLKQAKSEVLEAQLEFTRLQQTLEKIAAMQWILTRPEQITPISFPLWAESLRSQTISSESFQARVDRVLQQLERVADGDALS